MLNTSLKISEIKIYLDNNQFRVKVKSDKENKKNAKVVSKKIVVSNRFQEMVNLGFWKGH